MIFAVMQGVRVAFAATALLGMTGDSTVPPTTGIVDLALSLLATAASSRIKD